MGSGDVMGCSSLEKPLARFSVRKNEIYSASKKFKPKLFKPNSRLELSVCRIKGLQKSEIRCEGLEVVRNRKDVDELYGWALFDLSVVCEIGLQIKHDSCPSRHSDIIGWPEDEQRRIQMSHEFILSSCSVPIPPLCPLPRSN